MQERPPMAIFGGADSSKIVVLALRGNTLELFHLGRDPATALLVIKPPASALNVT